MEHKATEQNPPHEGERRPWTSPKVFETRANDSKLTNSNIYSDGVIYS